MLACNGERTQTVATATPTRDPSSSAHHNAGIGDGLPIQAAPPTAGIWATGLFRSRMRCADQNGGPPGQLLASVQPARRSYGGSWRGAVVARREPCLPLAYASHPWPIVEHH